MDLHLIGSGSYANVWASETMAFKLPNTEDFYNDITFGNILVEGLFLRNSFGIPLTGLCVTRPVADQKRMLMGYRLRKASGTLRQIMAAYGTDVVRKYAPQWTSELAYALDGLHYCGWVHGDLKSANMLVTNTGTAFLCDFGLAYPVRHKLEASHLYTMEYRPPELLENASAMVCTDRSHDIWCFGISVLECLENNLQTRGSQTCGEVLRRYRAWIPDTADERIQTFSAKFGEPMGRALAQALYWDPSKRSLDGFKRLSSTEPAPVFLQDCFEIQKSRTLQMDIIDAFEASFLDDAQEPDVVLKDSLMQACNKSLQNMADWALMPPADAVGAAKDAIRLLTIFVRHAFYNDQPLVQAVLAAHLALHAHRRPLSAKDAHRLTALSTVKYEETMREALVLALEHPRWCASLSPAALS